MQIMLRDATAVTNAVYASSSVSFTYHQQLLQPAQATTQVWVLLANPNPSLGIILIA